MKTRLMLRVIDGMPPFAVRMVKRPAIGDGCANDNHCACHGPGPFFCCKCGAEFEIAEEQEAAS